MGLVAVKSFVAGISHRLHYSQRTTLVIVFMGLMLDNLLLTVVVPILPDYLYEIEHPKSSTKSSPSVAPIVSNTTSSGDSSISTAPYRTFVTLDLQNENSRIGLLFSSKAFVQLFINPCVAIASRRYGYTIPLFFGLCFILVSALAFALGSSYGALLFARCIQGVGSSSLVISGMGLISSRYPEEEERSKNMGIALSGIAAGVLVGYPFGSVLYDFAGKTLPFVLIAIFVSLLVGVQFLSVPPQLSTVNVQYSSSTKALLQDRYILAVITAVCISTSAMAILEPCLPIWLLETMQPEQWQLGTAFVPDSIGYFLGSSFFGVFALRVGRWKCSMIAMLVVGISCICIPFATAIWHLILPHFGLGLGIGIVDASFMPLLALLVDLRHEAVYGSVFAVAQLAVCLAYSAGPLVGGVVANFAGFPFLMRTVGILNILICPICLMLRSIPLRAERQTLLPRSPRPSRQFGSFNNSSLYQTLQASASSTHLSRPSFSGSSSTMPMEGASNNKSAGGRFPGT